MVYYLKKKCSQNSSIIKFQTEYSFLLHFGLLRFPIIIYLHSFWSFTLKKDVVKIEVLLNFKLNIISTSLGLLRFPIIIYLHSFWSITLKKDVVKIKVLLNFKLNI